MIAVLGICLQFLIAFLNICKHYERAVIAKDHPLSTRLRTEARSLRKLQELELRVDFFERRSYSFTQHSYTTLRKTTNALSKREHFSEVHSTGH